MKIKYLLISLAILASACGSGIKYEQNIRGDFDKMCKAFISGDYNAYLDFIYPVVVSGYGGKDKALEMFKNYSVQMAEQGKKITAIKLDSLTKPVRAGKQIHCLVIQTIEMKVPGGTQKSENILLAISDNMGKTWTFFDVTMIDKSRLKILIPDFNDDLEFPQVKDPVFIPDDAGLKGQPS